MSGNKGASNTFEEEQELRRGPWTLEEDSLLIHYIARHGEGRWNLLARSSGLKRTGKSCRLRWLNYLKPDIKRGNLTPEEQYLILELHSKWGNRWSRIAQYLPGRTDNEIKNYWRTRVQKHARQLKIDTNSSMFMDAVRFHWMPRFVQKFNSSASCSSSSPLQTLVNDPTSVSSTTPAGFNMYHDQLSNGATTFDPSLVTLTTQEHVQQQQQQQQLGIITCPATQLPNLYEITASSISEELLAELPLSADQIFDGARNCTNDDDEYGFGVLDVAMASLAGSDWADGDENSCGGAVWGSSDDLWHLRKLPEWGGI